MEDNREEDKDAEFKEALVNFQLLQSRFCRKLNDLKALRHSISDAAVKSQTTQQHCNKLATELENLTNLHQLYESCADEFHDRFAVKYYKESFDATKLLDENLNASRNIQVNVDILLRKVSTQLVKENNDVKEGNKSNRSITDDQNKNDGEFESESGIEEVNSSNDKGQRYKTLAVTIFCGLLIVIAFYFGLGAIIKVVQDSEKHVDIVELTTRKTVQPDNSTCGADSFMIRDGVCDEKANILKCLYDGGDCCKENKNRRLCRDCKCILAVDNWELEKHFAELDIKHVKDQESLANAIAKNNKNGWSVKVEDVVSLEVCSLLCLEHKKADELNAWLYQANQQICLCGWIESQSCPEEMVTDNLNWEDANATQETITIQRTAFIQLAKTVPCGRCKKC